MNYQTFTPIPSERFHSYQLQEWEFPYEILGQLFISWNFVWGTNYDLSVLSTISFISYFQENIYRIYIKYI